jgi:hypothetical protein
MRKYEPSLLAGVCCQVKASPLRLGTISHQLICGANFPSEISISPRQNWPNEATHSGVSRPTVSEDEILAEFGRTADISYFCECLVFLLLIDNPDGYACLRSATLDLKMAN